MSTIKQDRKDLEALLNGISPLSQTGQQGSVQQQPVTGGQPQSTSGPANPVIDGSGGGMFNEEKLFDFDIDSIRKGLRKRARKTVINMAKHILPDDMMEREYIQDKIEQDIETLADLYVQIECNKTVQASLIDTFARGNTTPRLYEVFGQLTDKIAGLNKQALATEQTIRKTYIDLKFEIRDKDSEVGFNPSNAIAGPEQKPQLPDNSVIVTSSKDLNNLAKQRHREMIERAKEASYTETN